nr:glycosyltransferase [Lachnospiraceae bacterium]
DSSKYLEDILKDEEDCILFTLDAIEEMPAKVKRVLEHPEALKKMVKQGYDLAHKSHLWAHRAQFLMPYIDGEITVD